MTDAGRGAVRTYGSELAVLTVTGRRARISVTGVVEELDVGEEIGVRAVVNRAVAALPEQVGLVAVATPEVTWAVGALDALTAAAIARPRAAVLGPVRRDPSGAPLAPAGVAGGALARVDGTSLLLRRVAWDSVDGYATRITDPRLSDADLGVRLARAGWLVMAVPDAEVVVHPAGRHGMLGA